MCRRLLVRELLKEQKLRSGKWGFNLAIEIESDNVVINHSETTMENCFDFKLEHGDYTIGKVLEYALYEYGFVGKKDAEPAIQFCGFKKMHPHDKDSIIRIAYKEDLDKMAIKQNLKECIADAINVYKKIQDKF